MNKVSIIVPIYNCCAVLEKGINSLINQTCKYIEIILVDDGSSDGSEKICEEYAKKDNRIKVIHQKNQGVSQARNNGLASATGKYIFFMDADDYLDENAIEKLISISTKKTLARLSIARHFEKNIKYEKKIDATSQELVTNIIDSKEDGYCWGFLFEKKQITNSFDLKTSFMEDTLFLIKYISNINNIVSTTDTFYHYIDNSNGISSPKGNIYLKIKNATYSLSEISKEATKFAIANLESKINYKKILIIEYLMQNANKQQIKEIVNDSDIKLIFNNADNFLNFRFRFFAKLIRKEKILLIILYYKTRKILKKMKRGK